MRRREFITLLGGAAAALAARGAGATIGEDRQDRVPLSRTAGGRAAPYRDCSLRIA